MTPRAVDTLAGKDAQVFDALTRVIRWGQHTGRFTAADVGRVASLHLPGSRIAPRVQEQIVALTARAEEAELRADEAEALLRRRAGFIVHPWKPPPSHRGEARQVVLRPREAETLWLMCSGVTDYGELADRLGCTPHAVAETVRRMCVSMGAKGRTDALVKVLRGEVAPACRVIKARQGRRAA